MLAALIVNVTSRALLLSMCAALYSQLCGKHAHMQCVDLLQQQRSLHDSCALIEQLI